MNFLIQTIDGKVKHDFSFTLIESLEYQNWYTESDNFKASYINAENGKVVIDDAIKKYNYIPIGSVEFVTKYLEYHYNKTPKPVNIPEELINRAWTGRDVINGTEKDITGIKFVKSNDKIKSFTEICDTAPQGNYQISDIIDIQSEWRAFVFEGKLVGLQNYSGDFDVFPNPFKIKAMICAYESQPVAFTLDVAITKRDDTVIIEVHDFFSVGLYGFADHRILPYMFSKWFNNFIK